MPPKPVGPTAYRTFFDSVSVWREDLVEVVKLIRQAAPEKALEITTDSYQLDDIEELKDLPELKVALVKIKTRDGGIEFEVSDRGAWLEVPDQGLVSRGLATSIQLLMRRLDRNRWAITYLFALVFLALGAWSAKLLDEYGPIVRLAAILTGGAIGFYIMANRYRRRYVMRSLIYTRTRKEAPTFWMRKRDDIWIALVSLLLGGVLGYIVNMLT